MATAQTSTFIYKGKNKKGKAIQGEIKGASLMLAKAQLRKQGIATTSVKKKAKPLFGGTKPTKPSDICAFTRQMATMMKAGVPLVQSFDIVAEGADKESLRELVTNIRDDVASGLSFGSSLRKHPRYFDNLFCSLVEAGEQAGALETMLDRIATYKEKTETLKAKIRKAMTYPAAVVLVAIIVTAILLIKVVPIFAQTFNNFGADLPAFTQFVLNISETVQEWWFIWLVSIIAFFFGIRELRKRSPSFEAAIDKYSLKLPIVGDILYKAVVARFARTLSTTFAAGVPLVDALNSVAGASGNAIYRVAINKVRDDVTTGIQLHWRP
jgi:type IV pilus assembly protein PilC